MNAFDVDLAGLLRVFGGHLYSDPAVFVRELVQNAADAIVLRRAEEPAHTGAITVRTENGAVIFEDDGIGLDAEGIALALGRIGYSTKRAGAPAGTAGQFGIGLLSGFLVAERIVVTTQSRGRPGVRWIGRADGAWSVEPAATERIGTSVRLELAPAHRDFADPARLHALLQRYVRYLPVALRLGGERIDETPPWLAADLSSAGRDYAAARGAQALAVLPIEIDSARGFLWLSHENALGSRISLYQHGFLIEEGARELLPSWAGFVGGALDSSQLSPTASRETYVRDAAAASLANQLRSQLLHWLASLPSHDLRLFEQLLRLHAAHLRGACAGSPELLDAIGDRIPMESNFGELDLPTLLASSGGDRALRVVDSPQSFAHVSPLATAQGLPLVNAIYVHDREFLDAWARRRSVQLLPMDLQALDVLLRPAPEMVPRFSAVLGRARALLEPLDVEPDLGRFEPRSLPAFLVTEPTALRERARAIVRHGTSIWRAISCADSPSRRASAARAWCSTSTIH
jgi:molecular chaperone HtpG